VGYVTLSLYTLVPPRRLLDYTAFKVRDTDPEKDNHLAKGKLIFNRYKTAKTYGKQEVTAPDKLEKVTKQWNAKRESEYLLRDASGKALTAARLNQLLSRTFGKKVPVNTLRHSYVSEKVLHSVPALRELEKASRDVGHSLGVQTLYKKSSPVGDESSASTKK
jgi:hypothetical protein